MDRSRFFIYICGARGPETRPIACLSTRSQRSFRQSNLLQDTILALLGQRDLGAKGGKVASEGVRCGVQLGVARLSAGARTSISTPKRPFAHTYSQSKAKHRITSRRTEFPYPLKSLSRRYLLTQSLILSRRTRTFSSYSGSSLDEAKLSLMRLTSSVVDLVYCSSRDFPSPKPKKAEALSATTCLGRSSRPR